MSNNQIKKQAGFTLVELAIVMIIVGLLIGGILKGQELIANARVAATVSQIKAIDAAMNTFFEAYAAIPGDMQVPGAGTPNTRLPNCINACNQDGNGNGRIDGVPGIAWPNLTTTATYEGGAAFAMMNAADVLGGINLSGAVGDAPLPGVSIPSASVPGSSIKIGFSVGAVTAGTAAAVRAGHYLLVDNSRAAASSAATTSMLPSVAFRIDTKLDDGLPNTGSAIGMGGAAATTAGNCAAAGGAADAYNQALTTVDCGIYARIGG